MDQIERAARTICALSPSGFCQDVGGDLGCKGGRGAPPSADLCPATREQLSMAGYLDCARAVAAVINPR